MIVHISSYHESVKIQHEKPMGKEVFMLKIMVESVRNILPSKFRRMLVAMIPQHLLRKMKLMGIIRVHGESYKARTRRNREAFFELFCAGRGLDIGYGGDLLTPGCDGWDMEQGDAQCLATVKDCQYDFVYSSHTLEHMPNPDLALCNWWRVVKPGGALIVYVPDRDLYEKKTRLPSKWNPDHKHFFLLDRDESPDTIGIVPLIKRSLKGATIVYAKVCSDGNTALGNEVHSDGEYSIEVVIRKEP